MSEEEEGAVGGMSTEEIEDARNKNYIESDRYTVFSSYKGGYTITETKTENAKSELKHQVDKMKLQTHLEYLKQMNRTTWNRYIQFKEEQAKIKQRGEEQQRRKDIKREKGILR